jgi:hypothetical protein
MDEVLKIALLDVDLHAAAVDAIETERQTATV